MIQCLNKRSQASVMNLEKIKELGISVNHFKTIKYNIDLYKQVSDAKDMQDLREVLYILIDKCFPCAVSEWQKVRELIEDDEHNA